MATREELNWLEKKAYDWALQVRELYDTRVPPNLQPEKDKLLSRAKKIKDSIEAITGPLKSLEPLAPITSELGVIPVVIGVVGVGAALAAITYWITSYGRFKERLKLENQLRYDGITDPQQRAQIIATTLGDKSLAEKIFDPQAFLPLALVGALGLYFWRR